MALKEIKMENLFREYRGQGLSFGQISAVVANEAHVLSTLHHRNIVRLVDSFSLGKSIFICAELVHGRDLISYITLHPNGVPQDFMKTVFWQLCEAVTYLRSCNVSSAQDYFEKDSLVGEKMS